MSTNSPQEPVNFSVADRSLYSTYDYDIRKAELQSADLKRYGIQTVWVEEYSPTAEGA
jgi:hypothetical protein